MGLDHDWRPAARHSPALEGTRRALDIVFGWLEAGLEFDGEAPTFVASLFLTRGARNLNAVRLLAEAGYAVEGQALMRGMVEDAVTLGYISTQPEKLAPQWLTFENHRILTPPEIVLALNGALRAAEGSHVIDSPVATKYRRWTRLSVSAMAERADSVMPGISDYLNLVYPVLSDRAHGNTSTSGSYVRVQKDGALEPKFRPSNEQVGITLCNAVTMMLATAERCHAMGTPIELAPLRQAEQDVYRAAGMPVGIPPIGYGG